MTTISEINQNFQPVYNAIDAGQYVKAAGLLYNWSIDYGYLEDLTRELASREDLTTYVNEQGAELVDGDYNPLTLDQLKNGYYFISYNGLNSLKVLPIDSRDYLVTMVNGYYDKAMHDCRYNKI